MRSAEFLVEVASSELVVSITGSMSGFSCTVTSTGVSSGSWVGTSIRGDVMVSFAGGSGVFSRRSGVETDVWRRKGGGGGRGVEV